MSKDENAVSKMTKIIKLKGPWSKLGLVCGKIIYQHRALQMAGILK